MSSQHDSTTWPAARGRMNNWHIFIVVQTWNCIVELGILNRLFLCDCFLPSISHTAGMEELMAQEGATGSKHTRTMHQECMVGNPITILLQVIPCLLGFLLSTFVPAVPPQVMLVPPQVMLNVDYPLCSSWWQRGSNGIFFFANGDKEHVIVLAVSSTTTTFYSE